MTSTYTELRAPAGMEGQHLPSATHPLQETQCKQQEKTAETHLRYLGG